MTERPLSQIVRDILVSVSELIRSEIQLAKVEVAWSAKRIGGQGSRLAIGGALALFGALCVVTFLVIALGALFGDNYWLSALLVGAVMLGIGGALISKAMHEIRQTPLKPTAVTGLQNDRVLVTDHVSHMKDSLRKTA